MPEKKDDLLFSARFAFKPNQLQYCGPDKNNELLGYINNEITDAGLTEIFKRFECFYQYLKLIARENKIADPLAQKVSEAYWIGNELLENVSASALYGHAIDGMGYGKILPVKETRNLRGKMPRGANAHHSFHVFNVWQQAGLAENPAVLKMMDECRIGWGQVQDAGKDGLNVIYEPIVYKNGCLAFGEPVLKKIAIDTALKNPKKSDWIAFHWSSYCGVLSPAQLKNIIKWTTINLQLANKKDD